MQQIDVHGWLPRLVFDFGFERQEMVFTEQSFMTGQYHDVTIERYDNGRKLRMTIDNYAPQEYDFTNSLKSSADAQVSQRFLCKYAKEMINNWLLNLHTTSYHL